MRHIRSAVLAAVVSLLFTAMAFAGTGILEIRSEPSGAHISIDDVDAGTTPYQNTEMPAGKHTVKAVLGPEYPPQVQEVLVDEQAPQVVLFKFLSRSTGTFSGKEIVLTATKYTGNVTFASIPTGAAVVMNGELLKKTTPIGYTDVEVGRYSVVFRLGKRTLRANFDVVQDETIKLIADFSAGKVVNKWEEAKQEKARQEEAKREAEKQEAAKQQAIKREAAKQGETAQAQPANQPAASTSPATAPSAAAAETLPQPVEGAPPFGELSIRVQVSRDANLKYSDYFDLLFPKVPIDSLSGQLFPAASTVDQPNMKDNFEFRNNADENTRQFFARIHFGARTTAPSEQWAQSGVMTVREGKYDLKIARRRMVEGFYSVDKLLDAAAREPVEIVRGSRLIVQISSHLDANNELRYEITRSYEVLGRKKSGTKTSAQR